MSDFKLVGPLDGFNCGAHHNNFILDPTLYAYNQAGIFTIAISQSTPSIIITLNSPTALLTSKTVNESFWHVISW